jgi:DNA (cytosine-5)-methyltransferase 1
VSFFSGCGGLDLGFDQAGFNLGFANDFFLDAVKTYAHNLGPIDPRPIQQIAVQETGPADVLLAGFPCQPFSNAGSRLGTADPRGTLFWETLKFVEFHRPRVVVFENVRGLLSMRNPDGGLLIDAIETELASRGYLVAHKLLNASEYGVPQNRHRVFIVGIREDLGLGHFNFEEIEKSVGATVGDVLAKPFGAASGAQEHWPLSPQAMDLVNFIPPGGSWKSVPDAHLPLRLLKIKSNMARYHSPNFYRRFAPDEIMGTVTASATPENSGILHPHLPRRYTIREIARFQSFPDSYDFSGKSIAAKYKQIGNAVPPELARRLALAILKLLQTS